MSLLLMILVVAFVFTVVSYKCFLHAYQRGYEHATKDIAGSLNNELNETMDKKDNTFYVNPISGYDH
jgi:hypothetical protein